MTNKGANEIRAKWTKIIMELVSNYGEDCELVTSNAFNFPVCTVDENGNNDEEGCVVVTIKVPKDDSDYEAMREEFKLKTKLKAEKAKADAEKKARKIERDKQLRAEKQAQLQKLRDGKL